MKGLWRGSQAVFLGLIWAASLGAATAQFETRTTIPSTPSAYSVAVGDFNRDGKLDFVIADSSLQVFLGNGDGTFQPPVNYLAGTGAFYVTAADLNHDGKLDLVVTDLSGLFILLGNEDGTFQAPTSLASPCGAYYVAIGDFNGDHKLDLLVTYASGNCPYVSIFLGNGDGTFQEPPINTTPSYTPSGIGIGDFNRDGKLDLAVGEQFGGISQAEILLGNGDGTFSLGATYPVYASPLSVAVADLRGNGKLDFAVASLNGTLVLLGNGDGTFQPGQGIGPTDAAWVIAADFNGDGKPDLAVAVPELLGAPSGVTVALGNGDGTFQPVFYPGGRISSWRLAISTATTKSTFS